jgi:hypothetical protein
MFVFWVVTPCGLVGRYQCFGEKTLPPSSAPEMKAYVPSKRWYLPTSPHGVITQKTNIDIFTAVSTSNFIFVLYPPYLPTNSIIEKSVKYGYFLLGCDAV